METPGKALLLPVPLDDGQTGGGFWGACEDAPAQRIAFRRRDIDHGAISEAICADMATHCRFGHRRDSEQKRDSVECKCEGVISYAKYPKYECGRVLDSRPCVKFSPEKLAA
jgi:hypothetical protein